MRMCRMVGGSVESKERETDEGRRRPKEEHLISPMKDIRERKNRLGPPSAQMISSKTGGRKEVKSDKFGKGWDGGLDVRKEMLHS